MRSDPVTDLDAQQIFRAATPEWLGGFGEAIWKNVLAASGWRYVSLTKICEGGAPLARGNNGHLILPDFDAYKDDRAVFVEAKAKTQSIVYRNKRQERHGINQLNYQHYGEVQRQSGKPCCIGIVELWRESTDDLSLYWSGALLFEKLVNLFDPRAENQETPPKVYWRRKQFVELHAGLAPLELFSLARGAATRTTNLPSIASCFRSGKRHCSRGCGKTFSCPQ